MLKSMLCVMCLTERRGNTKLLCDSCKAILLNTHIKVDEKLKEFLLIHDLNDT